MLDFVVNYIQTAEGQVSLAVATYLGGFVAIIQLAIWIRYISRLPSFIQAAYATSPRPFREALRWAFIGDGTAKGIASRVWFYGSAITCYSTWYIGVFALSIGDAPSRTIPEIIYHITLIIISLGLIAAISGGLAFLTQLKFENLYYVIGGITFVLFSSLFVPAASLSLTIMITVFIGIETGGVVHSKYLFFIDLLTAIIPCMCAYWPIMYADSWFD